VGRRKATPTPFPDLENLSPPPTPLTPQAPTPGSVELLHGPLRGAGDLKATQKDMKDDGPANVPASQLPSSCPLQEARALGSAPA
jgi:hypothetical protein